MTVLGQIIQKAHCEMCSVFWSALPLAVWCLWSFGGHRDETPSMKDKHENFSKKIGILAKSRWLDCSNQQCQHEYTSGIVFSISTNHTLGQVHIFAENQILLRARDMVSIVIGPKAATQLNWAWQIVHAISHCISDLDENIHQQLLLKIQERQLTGRSTWWVNHSER